MSLKDWVVVLGIPGMLSTLIGVSYVRIKAIRMGIQALLRDRLLQSYDYHSKRGYCSIPDRENWINMYNQYHNLGLNGVMDDIERKFLELPTRNPKKDKDE